jgi:predicted nucleotidyltransferase
MRSALVYELAQGIRIRILSAPAFLATKWEAFEDRGAGDPYGSHDLEDIVSVVAGRPEVVAETRSADSEVRQYLADHTRGFLESGAAADVIAGALPDARLAPELLRSVEERFRAIAAL